MKSASVIKVRLGNSWYYVKRKLFRDCCVLPYNVNCSGYRSMSFSCMIWLSHIFVFDHGRFKSSIAGFHVSLVMSTFVSNHADKGPLYNFK